MNFMFFMKTAGTSSGYDNGHILLILLGGVRASRSVGRSIRGIRPWAPALSPVSRRGVLGLAPSRGGSFSLLLYPAAALESGHM